MVEFKTRITTTGVLYIPKELREAFSRNLKIVSDAKAALFFPADATYKDVLKSMRIIRQDIIHRMELAEKEVKKNE